MAQIVKNLPAMLETQVWYLKQEDPLEKGIATHSSILAWRIPWTEELDMLQSMGSQRVGPNWMTNTFTLPDGLKRSQDLYTVLPTQSCFLLTFLSRVSDLHHGLNTFSVQTYFLSLLFYFSLKYNWFTLSLLFFIGIASPPKSSHIHHCILSVSC